MKVAIFIDDFSATGVVTNAVAIARELDARGMQVRLIATQAEGPLIEEVPPAVSIVGLLPNKNSGSSRRGRLRRSLAAFRKQLRLFSPDVLFSAGNHGHLASALVSRALPRCRTIVRISNDLDHMIGGKPSKPFSRWWRVAKFRAVAAVADRLVFVSRHLARSRAVSGTAAVTKAVVIPNGVDVASVRQRAAEECPHKWCNEARSVPLVLGVGRLALQKNFINLVRAVAIARQSRDLRLLLVGSGPLKSELLKAAAELGIADAVEIIPPVRNPLPYIAQASVLALPSWWEGSSNVLLEALACETPVVASRTAGNAEDVLDYGRYGLLIEPDDPEGMAAALLVQCSNEVQLPGDRASHFSRESMLDAYAELIAEQAAA
ncbi:MAG TPA: glycosyltransferase [Sphingomicrobium sp.]|nr:glycosyltransferase [Sphingomicrobium sp.]